VRLSLAIESPLKSDGPLGGLRFRGAPVTFPVSQGKGEGVATGGGSGPVMFRGTVEVSGLDGPSSRPAGRQAFHLVQRAGQEGPALGTITLAPGAVRQVQVRLIYPADATPPQVLSLLPVGETPGTVKQSPVRPPSPDP